jgi:hypothetical protein
MVATSKLDDKALTRSMASPFELNLSGDSFLTGLQQDQRQNYKIMFNRFMFVQWAHDIRH